MGSYCSCPDPIPDNHQSKFKVINVDDDGNELGSGVMELTEEELVLHTRSRESVRWPYLCLRRYGYDSNLFSFESGRRCQTGQGIFAFKCVRAEEIFNLLQDVMHSNSISVVEEPLPEPNHSRPESESLLTPPSPTTPGSAAPALPNGVPRLPSLGEASSHPSSRHPSVGSARLPSVGEESTHPLLVTEETVHTYVNTSGVQEERRKPAPLEVRTPSPVDATLLSDDSEGQVLLEPEGVKFVLGPTPVQRQRAGVRPEKGGKGRDREAAALPVFVTPNGDVPPSQPGDKDTACDGGGERHEAPSGVRLPYEHLNGAAPAANPRRARPPFPALDGQNANNSAQRRTALLDYENLPVLPPVWEARWPSSGGEDEDEELEEALNPKTSFLNGYHQGLDPAHNYVNTENVTVPLSAHKLDRTAPTIFDFDFRQKLNYIEVEMEKGSDSSDPQTPTTPLPQTPTRRNELYAIIDVERTAAMSSLQKALPRDDGTSRKTRHNSTDLPL